MNKATLKFSSFKTPQLKTKNINPMRKCANKLCRSLFEKRSMTHVACSVECALIVTEEKKKKIERKEYAERKKSLKTRSDYIKETQIAFNSYVRERDKELNCICCDKPLQKEAIVSES